MTDIPTTANHHQSSRVPEAWKGIAGEGWLRVLLIALAVSISALFLVVIFAQTFAASIKR